MSSVQRDFCPARAIRESFGSFGKPTAWRLHIDRAWWHWELEGLPVMLRTQRPFVRAPNDLDTDSLGSTLVLP
jgi:hypothetical protein